MSLNQIEELTAALVKAEQGELSDKEFQIVVLRSLISLKESHVSVRSRLYNVEKFKMLVKVKSEAVQPLESPNDMGPVLSSCLNNGVTQEELKKAKEMFDKDSVKLYQKVFLSRAQPSSDTAKPLLGFNETVDLLDELNFNHYGDGHYPLSHYLREIVGADIEVIAFTDFLQAVSISVSKPIPLVYKQAFEEMDIDGNGRLDAKEVFNMMKKVTSKEYSWEEIEEFLSSIDDNNDGTMDYSEMLTAYYFT